jgi:hypothetical protein
MLKRLAERDIRNSSGEADVTALTEAAAVAVTAAVRDPA